MPPEGLDWLPGPALLTDDEVARLIGIAVQQLGITEIRFTGGEPLLRRGLAPIVARTAALRPRPEISLTTNGIGLARLAGPLRDCGLDRFARQESDLRTPLRAGADDDQLAAIWCRGRRLRCPSRPG
jgi:molybdenum cofactor biosynthesis enzyme MoaA